MRGRAGTGDARSRSARRRPARSLTGRRGDSTLLEHSPVPSSTSGGEAPRHMSSSTPGQLKKTPLNAKHRASGARMVEFGGWDMPVEYSGISDEHMAVRTRAGLFDVSHMGQIELAGPDALAAVQWMTSNDASRLAVGQVQYSALTTEQGTFVDDILVYRYRPRPLPAGRQCRQHREGLRLDRRPSQGAWRRRRRSSTRAPATRCWRCRARAPRKCCRR